MITGSLRRGRSGGFKVYIGGVELDPAPSQKIYNHSPNGFSWGYGGSGPAQLALALLLHYAGETFARKQYQNFKRDVIEGLPAGSTFELPEKKVKTWIRRNGGSVGTL